MRRSFRVAALVALALTGNLVRAAQAESAIQAAPAFTAQQQLAPPRESWTTNGDICNAYPPYAMHMATALPVAVTAVDIDPIDRHRAG